MNSRLRVIRKELKLTQEALAERLGVRKSAISMIETGRGNLSHRNKNGLVQLFNINPVWLETGRGEKFKTIPLPSHHPSNHSSCRDVPLYDIEVIADVASLLNGTATAQPLDHIYIPALPRCDGAIHLIGIGESMHPLISSGDIVLYKHTSTLDSIFWGDMHLISVDRDGEEFVTVKYIEKSDKPNHIRLTCENSRYSDMDIATDRIRAIALIKTTIRMSSVR